MNDKFKKNTRPGLFKHIYKDLQLYTNWLLSTYYYLYNIKRPTVIIVYSILVTTNISQNNRYNI